MDKIFLKPADPDGKVRSPDSGGDFLPVTGAWVSPSIYWSRRLKDVDVVDETAARQKADKAAAANAKKES